MPNSEQALTVAQQRFAKYQRWAGPLWVVLGVLMVGLWAWGALDGDLSVPLASDRFLAWSKLVTGVLFAVGGVVYTVAIRKEQRRRFEQTPPSGPRAVEDAD